MSTVILVYILFFFICLFFLFRYIKINKEATTISGILTSIIIFLCFIPIIILCFGDSYMLKYSYSCLTFGFESYFTFFVGLLIFIIFLLIGYERGLFVNRNRYIDEIRFEYISKLLGYFTLFVGGISFIIYANALGGFGTLLIKAEYMRSFATNKADLVEGHSYILVIPARLVTVSPYLLLIARNKMNNKFYNSLLIIISIILSSLFYLVNAGKTDVFIFGLSFLVPLLSYKFKHQWFVTICIAALCLGSINYLDALFVYFGTGEFVINEEEGNLSFLSQFSYPIKNILSMDDILLNHGYRYGQDFITGILNIIPGVNFEPSYQPTSEFFSGSDWKKYGGVPNDAVTFGYLQYGYIGVAVTALIFGRVCAKVDVCIRTLGKAFYNRVIKCTLIILFFIVFVNADIISIVRNQFALTILCGCIIYCSKRTFHLKNFDIYTNQ